MEVRVSRGSSVIVHRVSPAAADRFLEWQRGVADIMTKFPGYQTTDLYSPVEGQQQEWVVILHFDTPEHLQVWLDSPARVEWLAKLRAIVDDFQIKTLPGGFGAWFTGLFGPPAVALPPQWKIVLSILISLYPTVMLLTIFVGPFTQRFGRATEVLIGNVLSLCILQYAVAPLVAVVLAPWLRASGPQGRAVTVGGTALVLAAVAALALVFHVTSG